MKKGKNPEIIQSVITPLPQEVISWYLDMLDATPAEKVDTLLEFLDAPNTVQNDLQTLSSKKETR